VLGQVEYIKDSRHRAMTKLQNDVLQS